VSATFHDLQEAENPRNGTVLDSPASVSKLFESLSRREPFVFELRGHTGYTLTIGLAGALGFAQLSRTDGTPPYNVAVADEADGQSESIGFLAGNQPAEIPGRYCVRVGQIEEIATAFVTTGGRSETIRWQEI